MHQEFLERTQGSGSLFIPGCAKWPNFCLLIAETRRLDTSKTTTKYLPDLSEKKEMVECLEKLANYFLWFLER